MLLILGNKTCLVLLVVMSEFMVKCCHHVGSHDDKVHNVSVHDFDWLCLHEIFG